MCTTNPFQNSWGLHCPIQPYSSSHITFISMCLERNWVHSQPFLSFPKSQSLIPVISEAANHLRRPFPLHLGSAPISSHLGYGHSLHAPKLPLLGFSHLDIPSTRWLLEGSPQSMNPNMPFLLQSFNWLPSLVPILLSGSDPNFQTGLFKDPL